MAWSFYSSEGRLLISGSPGPAGSDGADGADGVDGTDGVDGRDGVSVPGMAGEEGESFGMWIAPPTTFKGAYYWTSKRRMPVGMGRRIYADRGGRLTGVVAFGTVPPLSTVTFDVLKNGTSIFPSATKPTLDAGAFVGTERQPDTQVFSKDDYFQIEVEGGQGGGDRLSVYLRYAYEV